MSNPDGVRGVRSGRLLALDDDPDICRMICRIAESIGLDGRCTADPNEFFRVLDEWQPTHVLLDLIMPEVDGIHVIAGLAERHSRVKIIITSGAGSRVLCAARRSASEHGLRIGGVIAKPFSPAALRDLLATELSIRGCGTAHADQGGGPPTRDPLAAEVSPEDLRAALDAGQLQLFYQPKVACATDRLAGFETLVRWMHPELGLIMPDSFIPVAEAHGLIDRVTDLVFEQALRWFAPHSRGSSLSLAVNLSARVGARDRPSTPGANPAFVEHVTACCLELGVDPASLIFELTETAAAEDPVGSLDLLTRLRLKGFQLSLDDFGTGYSSMTRLLRLPFSEIKLGRNFVADLVVSAESRNVVKAVIELGHKLGMRTVAEGVEDAETFAYLNRLDCDLAQGYFVAPPMRGDDVAGWISEVWHSGVAPTPGRPT